MVAVLLPSAPAVMVSWLTTQPDLAAIHGGRVATKLADELPAIRLQRIGGSPDEYDGTDEPSMQIECWAADDVTAERFARTLVSVLPEFRHHAVEGGRVYTYEVTSGPFFSPDDPNLSTNVRYILTVSLLLSA